MLLLFYKPEKINDQNKQHSCYLTLEFLLFAFVCVALPPIFRCVLDSLRSYTLSQAVQRLDLVSDKELFFLLDLSTFNALSVSLLIELWVSTTVVWKW